VQDDVSVFEPYQTDILFLLIGSNPLPNFVAALILARANASLFLLHSEKTSKVADRLARRLTNARSDLNIMLYGINQADGPSIIRKIRDIVNEKVKQSQNQRIGLNFTGGTKPMAAYAAMGIRQMYPKSILSYLDARTLSLIVDEGDGTSMAIPVSRSVNCTLKDILDLHGYRILSSKRPRAPLIASALSEIYYDPNARQQWRDWIRAIPTNDKLPTISSHPLLKPVINAFADVCSGAATEKGVAHAIGFDNLTQCTSYFIGGWLEVYTLSEINRIADQAGLAERYMSVKIMADKRPDFEIDLITVIGYQVFSISCIVSENIDKAKEHLLEIFARAGQFGGEEARFALLTITDLPDILEKEIREDWDAEGKIRVFGRNHIPELSSHLLKWFQDANQEAS